MGPAGNTGAELRQQGFDEATKGAKIGSRLQDGDQGGGLVGGYQDDIHVLGHQVLQVSDLLLGV